jgi:hypothetical protein
VRANAGSCPHALCDLEADLGEKINVPEAHPDGAECLRLCVKAIVEEVAWTSRPTIFVDKPKPLSKTENRE